MSLEHVLEYAHTHTHTHASGPQERDIRERGPSALAPFFSLRLRGEAGLQTTWAPQSGNYCLLEMHASLYIQLTKVEQNRYKRAHCFVFCKTGAVKGRNSGAQVAVAVQRGARRHRRSRAAQTWQLHHTAHAGTGDFGRDRFRSAEGGWPSGSSGQLGDSRAGKGDRQRSVGIGTLVQPQCRSAPLD